MEKQKTEVKNKPIIVFWVFAAFILLYGLGINDLWASEDRWAEIAREMLFTGDWFHPAINGEVYFDKPLLSYWLIVFFAKTFGMLNEFVVRLPSALSGLAALYCTIYLGTLLWKKQVGITAGWLLLSSMGFIFPARLAAADIMNMTAVIIAVSWFFYCKDRASFRHYLIFWLICFGGALTKGLPALVIPPLLVAAYVIMDKSWRKHVKVSHGFAAVICMILYMSTFWIAAGSAMPEGFTSPDSGLSGLELVWRENVIRVFNPFDHDDEPFFAYLYHMPRIMAPWAVLMVFAIIAVAMRWKTLNLNTRWLLVANAVVFVMFSCSGSRRWYYILPIMPFTALLISEYIAGLRRYKCRKLMAQIHYWFLMVYGILGILLICGSVFIRFISWEHLVPEKLHGQLQEFMSLPWIIIWAMVVAALPVLVIMMAQRRLIVKYTGLPYRWAAIIVSGTILMGTALSVVYPEAGRLRKEKEFAMELKKTVGNIKPENIVFYPKIYPKIIFYLDLKEPATVLKSPDELKDYMSQSVSTKYFIAESRDRTFKEISESLPELALDKPDLREERAPFKKPGARTLRCWRIEPKGKNNQ